MSSNLLKKNLGVYLSYIIPVFFSYATSKRPFLQFSCVFSIHGIWGARALQSNIISFPSVLRIMRSFPPGTVIVLQGSSYLCQKKYEYIGFFLTKGKAYLFIEYRG